MKKQILFSKLALFALLFTLMVSCKKTEVTTQSVVGTWNLQSVSGTATVAGKSVDLSKNNLGIEANKFVFKSDGTGTSDGDAFTYTVSGSTLSMTQSGITISLNVSVSNGTLTMTADDNGLKSLIALINVLDPKNAITKYNETMIYKAA